MKLEVLLLRHGQTQGNLEKRYIGKTDEPLLLDDTESMRKISALQKRLEQEGIAGSQKLFVSPMLRCRQTAELLFPGQEQVVIDKLREMDFGRFEAKNYMELSADPAYQAWIDSDGRLPFPEGEEQGMFYQTHHGGLSADDRAGMAGKLRADCSSGAWRQYYGNTFLSDAG